MAFPQGSQPGPPGQSVIVAASEWLASLLTGSISTALAVLAVAFIGLSMLQGHVPTKRAARVVLGLFVLFSAPLLASALGNLARAISSPAPPPAEVRPSPLPALPPQPPANLDPYAGASVPM